MLVACWSSKGGSGTTVVAAAALFWFQPALLSSPFDGVFTYLNMAQTHQWQAPGEPLGIEAAGVRDDVDTVGGDGAERHQEGDRKPGRWPWRGGASSRAVRPPSTPSGRPPAPIDAMFSFSFGD